ncbi:MAG: hypothetical protein KAW02_01200 [candidate division Zixibacteria bacterium]|nr:hypothetical protein [candidate division Zixibacteria bacterium]
MPVTDSLCQKLIDKMRNFSKLKLDGMMVYVNDGLKEGSFLFHQGIFVWRDRLFGIGRTLSKFLSHYQSVEGLSNRKVLCVKTQTIR